MQNDFVHFDRDKLQINVDLPEGKLSIGKDDVDISYFSKGSGGQNVNRHMNGVRLIYHIPEKHIRHFAKTRELVARSIHQRYQEQNLRSAFEILADRLRRYFYVAPERKKTKVPKKSKEKRLHDKKKKSQIKASRKDAKYDL